MQALSPNVVLNKKDRKTTPLRNFGMVRKCDGDRFLNV